MGRVAEAENEVLILHHVPRDGAGRRAPCVWARFRWPRGLSPPIRRRRYALHLHPLLRAGLGAAPDRRVAALQLSSRRPPRVPDWTVHAAKAFSAACSPLLKLSSVHM